MLTAGMVAGNVRNWGPKAVSHRTRAGLPSLSLFQQSNFGPSDNLRAETLGPRTATTSSRMSPPADDSLSPKRLGPVALVGAGPGDPELLTLRAVRRLEAADVVLHDSLIPEEVLNMVPRRAQLINVGKRCGDVKDRGLQQQEIHDLMLAHSRRGCNVVRLKCGDPFIFGRGGEELEFLAANHVPCEVVPGITSALGAAASCQVPLTHRGFETNHLHLCVGQSKAKQLADMDWAQMAKSAMQQTAVFYMGLKLLDKICTTLRSHGAPDETPMMLVESATSPLEKSLHSTLAEMPAEVEKQQFGSGGPVLIILGPTASFPAHLERLANGQAAAKRRKVDLCSDVRHGKMTEACDASSGEHAWVHGQLPSMGSRHGSPEPPEPPLSQVATDDIPDHQEAVPQSLASPQRRSEYREAPPASPGLSGAQGSTAGASVGALETVARSPEPLSPANAAPRAEDWWGSAHGLADALLQQLQAESEAFAASVRKEEREGGTWQTARTSSWSERHLGPGDFSPLQVPKLESKLKETPKPPPPPGQVLQQSSEVAVKVDIGIGGWSARPLSPTVPKRYTKWVRTVRNTGDGSREAEDVTASKLPLANSTGSALLDGSLNLSLKRPGSRDQKASPKVGASRGSFSQTNLSASMKKSSSVPSVAARAMQERYGSQSGTKINQLTSAAARAELARQVLRRLEAKDNSLGGDAIGSSDTLAGPMPSAASSGGPGRRSGSPPHGIRRGLSRAGASLVALAGLAARSSSASFNSAAFLHKGGLCISNPPTSQKRSVSHSLLMSRAPSSSLVLTDLRVAVLLRGHGVHPRRTPHEKDPHDDNELYHCQGFMSTYTDSIITLIYGRRHEGVFW
eukprot:s364_g6.t2